jgi:hypothetical protein
MFKGLTVTDRVSQKYGCEKLHIVRVETLSFIAGWQNRQQIDHNCCNGCLIVATIL